MRIAVFGLGYVGCVTAACLAKLGHEVCGVDISAAKVRMINHGSSPLVEKGVERLVSEGIREGRLRASLDPTQALERADLSLVCVGTPSGPDGEVNLEYVLRAVRDIGRALRSARRFHTVVIRSTVPPGSTENILIPQLERSARKKVGRDIGVCFHPEFLREGSSVHDFFHPPKTVIGTSQARAASVLVRLWKPIQAPLFITSWKVAEMVKYANNAFHGLKVCFANEIGVLCKSLNIDSHEVMRIFVRDRKLNISPLYLKPGFAFGGPCLPKDIRALCRVGRQAGLDISLLTNLLGSNSAHLRRALALVLSTGKKRIGVLGLVFKSDTDDLRESPACALVKGLLRAKREVRIYDPRVQLTRLLGANLTFVKREIPQLPRLLESSARELILSSQVIVVAGFHPEFPDVIRGLRKGQVLIDLMRLPDSMDVSAMRVMTLC